MAGVALVMMALAPAACSNAPDPTAPSNFSGVPVTDRFAGTLDPNGSSFYSFSMADAGSVSLTLVSMTGPSVPADASFPVGIGFPAGTGCTATTDAIARVGGSPQHTANRSAGVFCVRIADNGQLGAAAAFVLNITHPR